MSSYRVCIELQRRSALERGDRHKETRIGFSRSHLRHCFGAKKAVQVSPLFSNQQPAFQRGAVAGAASCARCLAHKFGLYVASNYQHHVSCPALNNLKNSVGVYTRTSHTSCVVRVGGWVGEGVGGPARAAHILAARQRRHNE